jgi:catalase
LVQAKKHPTPSPALSIHLKAKPTIEGRVVGCIVTDGVDGALFDALKKAVIAAGAKLVAIAPKIGGVKRSDGKLLAAEAAVVGAPSVLFDAVAVLASAEGGAILAHEGAAIDFVRDAFAHLKVMGTTKGAQALLDAAGLGAKKDAGVIALEVRDGVETLVKMAKKQRIWSREPGVRNVP